MKCLGEEGHFSLLRENMSLKEVEEEGDAFGYGRISFYRCLFRVVDLLLALCRFHLYAFELNSSS